ncbi:HAD-IA family hydrolase [Caulobacter sp. 17J80-11]|uniref:HAD-IA family hydrolase n=1 Tax=Caulobacter sp. 17J80-11 TaxID=2763502 RepID=UPI001653D13C|nr:HAD-IA family hydrolase [Caulobacter sp. 17J80-11]MBC6981953.1 HAD-IA family hydrolase [Caulobacter sp. 17J80-11]
MSLKLAVFDVDGTLVDSRQTILRAAVEAARDVGLPEPRYDAVRQIVGLSLHEALRVLAPQLTDAELAEFVARFQASFSRMHAEPGFKEPLYEGAERTLRRLEKDGWLIAMATGNSRRGVERLLANHDWSRLFVSTHCASDGPGKPHPAMLLEAMKASGCEPRQTVMIGDTGHDIRMALNAGTRAQGVGWGFHTPDEVWAAGAHHVANDFDELDAELDRFAAAL